MEVSQLYKVNTELSVEQIFHRFSDKKGLFFLDSSDLDFNSGQYHFLGYDPFLTFQSKNGKIQIYDRGKQYEFYGNPLVELKKVLKEFSAWENKTKFPFIGGAVGFFSYDLAHELESLPRKAVDDLSVQDLYIAFYNNIVIYDKSEQSVYISDCGLYPERSCVNEMLDKIQGNQNPSGSMSDFQSTSEIKSNFSKSQYISAINKIKNYILEGDIYQANLTQRFEVKTDIEPVTLYCSLRNNNPAPFAVYYDFGDGKILSSSPERFLKTNKKTVETKPIKGTIGRGANAFEDQENRNKLLNSEKDKSELLMIVDLERNDIGRVAIPGSVKVPKLFEIEEYATVYHLVSTITGLLKEEIDIVDCISATFPGGSITGAPKIRSMEIIDELEPTQRNIYTGSCGYIGFDGHSDLNILIRSILYKDSTAYFQVGGGITWDSDPESEYKETLHKGKALFKTLNANEIILQHNI